MAVLFYKNDSKPPCNTRPPNSVKEDNALSLQRKAVVVLNGSLLRHRGTYGYQNKKPEACHEEKHDTAEQRKNNYGKEDTAV